jgi:hypothetical protein
MELVPCNNENLLANFPPILRKNFSELFCRGKIGLSALTLNDISPTKQYTENDSTYSYYYTLKIPYAGKRLSWELIFDPEDMTFAPDFNFNDDSFYMSNDLELVSENLPSLANWNVNDPNALTTVLKELLCLFKKQQLVKLQHDNIYAQLYSEYQVLTIQISPSDVEIFLESGAAHFLINIKVDISSLPEYLQPMKDNQNDDLLNPGDDTCILKVSYVKLDGSKVNTSLQLSPRLDQVLGNMKTLHIPSYSKTTSLADYVNLVNKLLQDLVVRVEQHHKLKKEYIMTLAVMYSKNLIEFDSETFNRGEFLCEIDGYHCLVHIEIGELFPEEKPIVTLQSLYCIASKKICTERINDYSYSPRWSPELMLRKLRTCLAEIIPKFKMHKH